jgi:hypothetical protein
VQCEVPLRGAADKYMLYWSIRNEIFTTV